MGKQTKSTTSTKVGERLLNRPVPGQFRVVILFEKVAPETGEVLSSRRFTHPLIEDFTASLDILVAAVEGQDTAYMNYMNKDKDK